MQRNTVEALMERVRVCEHGASCAVCCWLWSGQQSAKGYGKASDMNTQYTAHNLLFKLVKGITSPKVWHGPTAIRLWRSCSESRCVHMVTRAGIVAGSGGAV